MNPIAMWRREAPSEPRRHELDAVYAELIETVLAQERSARREDRIDAIVRYADQLHEPRIAAVASSSERRTTS